MKLGINLEITSSVAVLLLILFLAVLLIPGEKLHFFESLVKKIFK